MMSHRVWLSSTVWMNEEVQWMSTFVEVAAAAPPVPFSAIVCEGASPRTTTDALLAPAATGENDTAIGQPGLVVTVAPAQFEPGPIEKSAALAPGTRTSTTFMGPP